MTPPGLEPSPDPALRLSGARHRAQGFAPRPRRQCTPWSTSRAALPMARASAEAGLEMGGKSGTSQVRRISQAERDHGLRKIKDVPWKERDHALFVAFAPSSRRAMSAPSSSSMAANRRAAARPSPRRSAAICCARRSCAIRRAGFTDVEFRRSSRVTVPTPRRVTAKGERFRW